MQTAYLAVKLEKGTKLIRRKRENPEQVSEPSLSG